jgi:hypothetical protein
MEAGAAYGSPFHRAFHSAGHTSGEAGATAVTGVLLTRPLGGVFVLMRCAREGLLHTWTGMSLCSECVPLVIYLSI